MGELLRWAGIAVGALSLAIWLLVAAGNWRWVLRRGAASPRLLVGPLFGLVGVGLLAAHAGLRLPWVWMLAVLVLDPGALPLVAMGIAARLRRPGPGPE